eukprot:513002-Hanusia_phi.AAC.1
MRRQVIPGDRASLSPGRAPSQCRTRRFGELLAGRRRRSHVHSVDSVTAGPSVLICIHRHKHQEVAASASRHRVQGPATATGIARRNERSSRTGVRGNDKGLFYFQH